MALISFFKIFLGKSLIYRDNHSNILLLLNEWKVVEMQNENFGEMFHRKPEHYLSS